MQKYRYHGAFDQSYLIPPSIREHLHKAFEILRKENLFARKSKCVFGQPQVEYLGHIIRYNGVDTDPIKVEAVSKWPEAKTIT